MCSFGRIVFGSVFPKSLFSYKCNFLKVENIDWAVPMAGRGAFLILFSGIPQLAVFFSMPICPYLAKYGHIGIWAYAKKNMAKWCIPEKSIKNAA